MRFRKKPVVIDALEVRIIIGAMCGVGGLEPADLPVWLGEALSTEAVRILDGKLVVRTLEGEMTADLGDWLIRGVKGEIYPCKPDIFEATYERVGIE